MNLDSLMSTAAFNGFQFSAMRLEALTESEYTLMTLVLDKSGSVEKFADQLFALKKGLVEDFRRQRNSRVEYVLLRVIEFNHKVDEVHGFMPIAQIDTSRYQTPHCQGGTALRDAVYSAVGATRAYARALAARNYLVNAEVLVATDGDDQHSRVSATELLEEIRSSLHSEELESIKTVLVAVNAQQCAPKLQAFVRDVQIDEYEDAGDIQPGTMARLTGFASRSLAATTTALGTGGPSQAVTF